MISHSVLRLSDNSELEDETAKSEGDNNVEVFTQA